MTRGMTIQILNSIADRRNIPEQCYCQKQFWIWSPFSENLLSMQANIFTTGQAMKVRQETSAESYVFSNHHPDMPMKVLNKHGSTSTHPRYR